MYYQALRMNRIPPARLLKTRDNYFGWIQPILKEESMLAIAEASGSNGYIPAHVGRNGIFCRACARYDDRLNSIRRHRLRGPSTHAPAEHHGAIAQKVKDAPSLCSLLLLTVITNPVVMRRVGVGTEFPVLHRRTVYFEH